MLRPVVAVTVSNARFSARATPIAADVPPVATAPAFVCAAAVWFAVRLTSRVAVSAMAAVPIVAVVRTVETVIAIAGVTVTLPPLAPMRASVSVVSEAVAVSRKSCAPVSETPSSSFACVSFVTRASAKDAPTPASPVAVTPSPAGRALTVEDTLEPAVTKASPPVRITVPATSASVSNVEIARATEPATEIFPPPAPDEASAEMVETSSAPETVCVALTVSARARAVSVAGRIAWLMVELYVTAIPAPIAASPPFDDDPSPPEAASVLAEVAIVSVAPDVMDVAVGSTTARARTVTMSMPIAAATLTGPLEVFEFGVAAEPDPCCPPAVAVESA